MPKIPMITAQGQPGILQLPRPTAQAFGAEGFGELARFGQNLGAIAQNLQDEKDEQEVLNLRTEYETGLAQIRTDLKAEPDYLQHDLIFTRKAQDLQRSLQQRTSRRVVSNAFLKHVTTTFAAQNREVQANALKLLGESELAGLDRLEEELSQKAGEAQTSEVRDQAIAEYQDKLGRSFSRGLLGPVKHQEKLQSFRQKTLEKNMDFLRRTDRSRLREMDQAGAFADLDSVKRLKILESARADEEREDSRNERAFKQAQDAVERHWSAQANQGVLRDSDLEAALKGQDPFITPDKARQLLEINNAPPTGGGSLQVRAIMEDYHSGPSTQIRIEATRELLNHLRRTLGKPNTLVDKALNELQTDERTGRTVRATELAAGIKFAEDEYRSRSGALLLGRIGRVKETQDLSEIRNRLRQAKDPMAESKKIVDEYLKRREKEAQELPDEEKNALELLR